MAVVEHGVVREVWFAPAGDPSDKNSFIIRDDAYSKREAVFGRTIRLGDPVDLGPFGGWRQTNWSGGMDQEMWRDEAMFELGTADVSERKGSVKLWNGYHGVYGAGNAAAAGFVPGLMASGATGTGEDTPIVWADTRLVGSGGTRRIRRWDPTNGDVELRTFNSDARAMSLIGNETGTATGFMLVGFSNGDMWWWRQTDNTWGQDTGVPGGSVPIGYKAMCPFNYATYYVKGNRLQRRVSGQHSIVRQIPEISEGRSMVVWNNRLWFIGIMSGGRTGVYVSDGYTVQLAFEIPGSFQGWDLCPHYGSLYVRGVINSTAGGDPARQQVWRYNGSSLTLLYEDDAGGLGFAWTGSLVSWGRHLVWPKHGSDATGWEAGVWLYDAEEDAIYMGPTMPVDPNSNAYYVTAICVWNNTLAVAMWDNTEHTASTVERPWHIFYLTKTQKPRAILLDGSTSVDEDAVCHTVATNSGNIHGSGKSFDWSASQTLKEQVILSSNFDAALPGEKKVWVKGFVRARIPEGCQVALSLLLDDNPTEHPIFEASHPGDDGWTDYQFLAICDTHNLHETSSKVRYKLYLRNLDVTSKTTSTPEVDVVGLDFMPVPTKRSQWHIRAVCGDDQARLDGSANPLATREDLVAKLTEYWESGVPLLFWEPRSDGQEPTDSGRVVMLQDFMEQTFRIDTSSDECISEVAFNVLEVA